MVVGYFPQWGIYDKQHPYYVKSLITNGSARLLDCMPFEDPLDPAPEHRMLLRVVEGLRGSVDVNLFDVDRERALLELLMERGPLVDGVTGRRTATVDGLSFEEYAKPVSRIAALLGG